MTTRYELSHVDFLDDSIGLRDGFVQGGHASLTHRLGARGSIEGENAEIRRANLNEGTRDYLFQNVGAVLQYRTGEHTSFDLSGGLAPSDRPDVRRHP